MNIICLQTDRARAIIILIIILLGSTSLAGCGGDDRQEQRTADPSEFGLVAPPPRQLDEVTSRMEIVVRGHYADVIEVRRDPVAVPAERVGALGKEPEEGSPYTLMRFEVSEYIVGDGPVEFVVGQSGDLSDPTGHRYAVAAPVFGQEITLIAHAWPGRPAVMVALSADYGRFTETNGRLAYAFLSDEKVGNPELNAMPFARGMTLEQFHEALRAAARARGMVVPE